MRITPLLQKIGIIFAVGYIPFFVGYLYRLPLNQILIGYIMIGGAFGFYLLLKSLRTYKASREEPMKKAFAFLQKWWYNDMATGEKIKWEDGIAKEGWYGNERVYGFNVPRMGAGKRLVAIVGTAPMRIIAWAESSAFDDTDPFRYFFKYLPLPAREMDIHKYPTVEEFLAEIKKARKKRKKKKEEEEEEEEEI